MGLDGALLKFSWPIGGSTVRVAEGICAELPESEVTFRARFNGLLGETRARPSGRGDNVLADFVERSDSFELVRRGVNTDEYCRIDDDARPDVAGAECVCVEDRFHCDFCGVERKRRQGDWGEPGCEMSEPCELVRDTSLDGERDMERLRLRTAELTSMW
jgi:hypothetical protein